jgi:hypothetical protein
MRITRNKIIKLAAVAAVAATAVFGFGGTAGAASGTVGPHTSGKVACIGPGSYFSGGSNLQAAAPVMKAYNYTTGVDRQTVTFRPVIIRWNGTAWVVATYGETLKGTATDSASPTTWYHTSTNASWGGGTEAFKLPPSNHYAVAYEMNWYYSSPVSGNPATLSGSDYQWASGYSLQSPMGAPLPNISYCST